jgi:hypothetical protein
MKLQLSYAQTFPIRAFTLESSDEQTPVIVNVVEAESGFSTLKIVEADVGDGRLKVVTYRTSDQHVLNRLQRLESKCEVRAEFGDSGTGLQAKFVLFD